MRVTEHANLCYLLRHRFHEIKMVITSEAYLLLDIVHTAYLVVVVLSNCSVPNLSSFIRVYYVLCSMT